MGGLGLGLVLVPPFQKHFVGIAAVGIAACTPVAHTRTEQAVREAATKCPTPES